MRSALRDAPRGAVCGAMHGLLRDDPRGAVRGSLFGQMCEKLRFYQKPLVNTEKMFVWPNILHHIWSDENFLANYPNVAAMIGHSECRFWSD